MLINFFYSFLLLSGSTTLTFFINFFLIKNNPSSNILDFFSRIYLNEAYISLFYFFWTSFWYLPATYLILVIFSYYLFFTKFLDKLPGLVILTFVALYCLDFIEYSFLNLSCTYLVMGSDLVNALLTNSINKYHPLIFYISTVYLFKAFVTNLKLPNLAKPETVTIILTLALGSWWASQEGSWGGWWNWDPSEVFGLLVMLCILVTGHNSLRNLGTYASTLNKLSTSLTVFITYFFIQLNFDIVSHNFGTKVGTYVSSINSLIFISILLSILNFAFYLRFTKASLTNLVIFPTFFYWRGVRTYSFATRLTVLLPRTYIVGSVFFLVASSFSLLVNDFLWKFLTMSVANYFINYSVVVSLLTLVLLFVIWDLQPTALITTWAFYFYQPCILPVLLLIRQKLNLASALHLTILLGLISNASLSSKTLTHWSPLWESFTTSILDTSGCQNPLLSLNQFNLGVTPKNLLLSFYNEYSYNFVGLGSSNEIHTFSHIITSNTSVQELLMGGVLCRSVVKVLNYDLNVITTLVLIICVYIRSIFFKKKIIVF